MQTSVSLDLLETASRRSCLFRAKQAGRVLEPWLSELQSQWVKGHPFVGRLREPHQLSTSGLRQSFWLWLKKIMRDPARKNTNGTLTLWVFKPLTIGLKPPAGGVRTLTTVRRRYFRIGPPALSESMSRLGTLCGWLWMEGKPGNRSPFCSKSLFSYKPTPTWELYKKKYLALKLPVRVALAYLQMGNKGSTLKGPNRAT